MLIVIYVEAIPSWIVWEYQNDQWRDAFKYSCCVGREEYSYSDYN